ncbi:ATP-binding protein [Paraconexibacter antarcticus]|uniref:ATP-binding protein n=1 Tax=Paraconexibacter antarcticus TaxID=2949664 RepID=A0ABY5DUU4_9ACTN|nr:ATP-binding protein [Paraconexibacter antarcticus]UTI64801.1 ATP-binding protein [Paraconexibacter antarcticus]
MAGTLGQRMAWRDERTFVGRERELALFDAVIAGDAAASVVFVHGPGGVGKSTLLREVARRAARHGFTPVLVEGRELAPVPGQIEAALDGVAAHDRPLVVFDTYERMAAVGGFLRSRLLPGLPEGSLVVLAGRRAPEPGWLSDGWEHITTTLELGPLGDEDATALIAQHGVTTAAADAEARVTALLRWADGSPLALALGAEATAAALALGDELAALPDLDDPAIGQAILRRLAGSELDGGDLDVLAVAAIARLTSAAMLRDVLPGTDPEEAEAWLRSLSFSEPLGAASRCTTSSAAR